MCQLQLNVAKLIFTVTMLHLSLNVFYTVHAEDVCQSQPCQNGASCHAYYDQGSPTHGGFQAFVCICPPGFTGTYCEVPNDVCQSQPCQNGATCHAYYGQSGPTHSGYQAYFCICPEGFKGTYCEITLIFKCPVTVTNPAGLYPILNDCGYYYQCSGDVAYRRPCPPGLHFNPTLFICDWPSSAGCQLSDDVCKSQPCQNGATCHAYFDQSSPTHGGFYAFYCICPEGFSGKYCTDSK